jgi:hypothetical protein
MQLSILISVAGITVISITRLRIMTAVVMMRTSVIIPLVIITVVMMRTSVIIPLVIITVVMMRTSVIIPLVIRAVVVNPDRAALLGSVTAVFLRDGQHRSQSHQDSEDPAESHPLLQVHRTALPRVG